MKHKVDSKLNLLQSWVTMDGNSIPQCVKICKVDSDCQQHEHCDLQHSVCTPSECDMEILHGSIYSPTESILQSTGKSELVCFEGYVAKVRNVTKKQLVKACVQDLIDYVLSFGLPGLPSGRTFCTPEFPDPPRHDTAKFFVDLLAPYFVVSGLAAQVHRMSFFDFGYTGAGPVPENAHDRLSFQADLDGKYYVDLDIDWHTRQEEVMFKRRPNINYIVLALGKLTEEGEKQLQVEAPATPEAGAAPPTRRRIRAK